MQEVRRSAPISLKEPAQVDLSLTAVGVLGSGQTDLLVTEVKGLLAPVPVQLQDGDDVPNGSEDG